MGNVTLYEKANAFFKKHYVTVTIVIIICTIINILLVFARLGKLGR